MAAEKTLAIVLRVVEFSETSCVATLFTRDFGKIGALAKGARRPKSPFEAALDVLAVCRIVFLHKSSDSLDLLTEARLERRFRAAQRDLTRLYAGYYVAELLLELTDAGDPHPELFDAADAALAALDGDADPGVATVRFELTALRLLGHLPALDACAGCGRPAPQGRRLTFGALAGGVLCSRCRVGQRHVLSVSPGAMDLLRRWTAGQPDEPAAAAPDPRLLGELRGVLNHYLSHLAGRRLKLTDYLVGRPGRRPPPPRKAAPQP